MGYPNSDKCRWAKRHCGRCNKAKNTCTSNRAVASEHAQTWHCRSQLRGRAVVIISVKRNSTHTHTQSRHSLPLPLPCKISRLYSVKSLFLGARQAVGTQPVQSVQACIRVVCECDFRLNDRRLPPSSRPGS